MRRVSDLFRLSGLLLLAVAVAMLRTVRGDSFALGAVPGEESSADDLFPVRPAAFSGTEFRHFASRGCHPATHAATAAHRGHRHLIVTFERTVHPEVLRAACPAVFDALEVAHQTHNTDATSEQAEGSVVSAFVIAAEASALAECLGASHLPPAKVSALEPLDKLHSDLREVVTPTSGATTASSSFDDGAPSRLAPWPVDSDDSTHVHPLHIVLNACRDSGADVFLADVARVLQRSPASPAVSFAAAVVWQGESAPAASAIPQRITAAEAAGRPRCVSVHLVLPLAVAGEGVLLPPQVYSGLAALPYVRRVEPAPRFTSQNHVATVTVQSETSNDRPLWAAGLTGNGQLVTVGDTGVDYDSCFFDDGHESVATFPAVNERHRKVLSYLPCILTNGEKEMGDVANAHGTHVAGSLAGNAQFAEGSTGATEATIRSRVAYNGMAKDAKLFVNDFTCGKRAQDNSMVLPGDMYEGYAPGYSLGARVSSFSWGDNRAPAEYNAILRRTDAFVFENPDMVLVFAAGNGGSNDGIISPAAAKAVLTIGAHPNSLTRHNRDHVCSFSAKGVTFDHRIKPDILTPGQPIMSSRSDGNLNSHQCELQSNFGTSMACPHAAGAAVLLRQYFTDGFYPSGSRDAAAANGSSPLASTIKAGLIHASHRFAHAQSAPDATEGFGRLQLGDAVFLAGAADSGRKRHIEYIEEPFLRHRQRADYCVTVGTDARSAVSDLRVTMAWTDPPFAAEGTHASVVNNVDLLVTRGSDGSYFYGNQDTSAAASPNRTQYDYRNVVERLVIAAPAAGSAYTVSVYAHHVVQPEGQNVSLVVSAPALHVTRGACAAALNAKCPTYQATASSRPVTCSGHGACMGSVCKCVPGYTSPDCSLCNGDDLCSGNGVCSPWTESCTCAAHVDRAAAANCSVCSHGWYGPHCSTDCRCSHGVCNKTAGKCACDFSNATGHWAGQHCDQCAFDYIRTAVDTTGRDSGPTSAVHCAVPATWCIHRQTREVVVPRGGRKYFIINDASHYENSMTCKWLVRSADPGTRVRVSVVSFQLEQGFDTMTIYNGGDLSGRTDGLARLQFGTGNKAPGDTVAQWNSSLLVHFESDFANVGEFRGFIGVAWAPRCDDGNCGGHGTCASPDAEQCICEGNFDAATGCTTCIAGFSGEQCDEAGDGAPVGTPSSNHTAVAGQSTAVAPSATGARTTKPATEATTTVAPVPTAASCASLPAAEQCSGHGSCQASGKCSCTAPYGGSNCEQQCPATAQTCSARGQCLANATCACEPGSTGVACQLADSLMLQLRPAESVRRFITAVPSAPWRYVRYVTATEQPLPYPGRQLIVTEVSVSWRIPRRNSRTDGGQTNDGPVPDATTLPPVTAQPTYSPAGTPGSPFLAVPAWSAAVWNDELHAGIAGREADTHTFGAGVGEACLTVVGWNRDYRQSTTVGLHMQLPDSVAAAADDAYPIVSIREFIDTNATAALASCPRGRVCSVRAGCIAHGGLNAQYELVEVDRTVHRQTAEELFSNNEVVLPLVAAAFVVACLATTAGKLAYSGWKTRRYATLDPVSGTAPDEDDAADGTTPGRSTRRGALARATRGGAVAIPTNDVSYGDSVIEMRPRAYLPTPAGGGTDPSERSASAQPQPAGEDDDDDDEALIGEAHSAAVPGSAPALMSPGGFAPGSNVPDFTV